MLSHTFGLQCSLLRSEYVCTAQLVLVVMLARNSLCSSCCNGAILSVQWTDIVPIIECTPVLLRWWLTLFSQLLASFFLIDGAARDTFVSYYYIHTSVCLYVTALHLWWYYTDNKIIIRVHHYLVLEYCVMWIALLLYVWANMYTINSAMLPLLCAVYIELCKFQVHVYPYMCVNIHTRCAYIWLSMIYIIDIYIAQDILHWMITTSVMRVNTAYRPLVFIVVSRTSMGVCTFTIYVRAMADLCFVHSVPHVVRITSPTFCERIHMAVIHANIFYLKRHRFVAWLNQVKDRNSCTWMCCYTHTEAWVAR